MLQHINRYTMVLSEDFSCISGVEGRLDGGVICASLCAETQCCVEQGVTETVNDGTNNTTKNKPHQDCQ